jgi:hypothetical protein
MPLTIGARCAFPDTTSFAIVPLDQLQSPVVRLGVDYWRLLRGSRPFPAREDVKPRDITVALSNMVLATVIDGGNDFILRIVGDNVVRAYRAPLINRRMSEIRADLPNSAKRWHELYRQVFETKTPVGVRGIVGHDAPEVTFIESEVVALPLGASADCVDHIMTFGYRVQRGEAGL